MCQIINFLVNTLQHLHNLTLPSWANSTVYEKLQLFKGLSFIWNVQTEEMKRLKVGPLLRRLLEEMKAKVDASYLILGDDDGEFDDIQPYEDPISYRKMYIYAGHDSTITAFLETLKLFQPHVPPYASALILELHKEPGTNDFYVEVSLLNLLMPIGHYAHARTKTNNFSKREVFL